MYDSWFSRRGPAEAVHSGMGTQISHLAFGRHAEKALRGARREAFRLENLLSRFLPGSDISRINRFAGVKNVRIGPEAFEILVRANECSVVCGGLFDITVGPLADLWDYKHAHKPPSDDRIAAILPLVHYADLKLEPSSRAAGLKMSGQSLDLGGIGKGYASDRFMEVFRSGGVSSALSNIGGNVSTLGAKPDGSPWRVGIRHPRKDGLLGALDVSGRAVVTSGDYERFFLDDKGRRFHHILDPVTGYPAASGLVSVTIVADSAMTADALSTAVFVAGLERGLAILEKYPQAEAVMADDGLRVFVTRGLRGCFQASPDIYVKCL